MKPPTQQYQGMTAAARLADRRERLIEAGIDLFGTSGFRATSIDEVCARAGLTKRYFYESFASREALLMAVYDEVNDQLQAQALAHIVASAGTNPDVLALTDAIITAIFTHLRDEPKHGRILFVEVLGVSPEVDRKYLDNTSNWEKLLVALVPDDSSLTARPALLARAALGTVVGMAVGWIQSGKHESVEEIVGAIRALFSGELSQVRTAG